MESDIYITKEESRLVFGVLFSVINANDDLGIDWDSKIGLHKIVCMKTWMLAKIKYGI